MISEGLYLGDCLEVMKDISDKSIQCIIADPPYGLSPLHWDTVVPLEELWSQYTRILKDNGVVLIFGQEPFSSYVRLSNIKMYRYDIYWEKERLTNVFQVKRRPGKVIENISVFYNQQCKYFPQKNIHEGKLVSNKIGENARFSTTMAGNTSSTKPREYVDSGFRYPTQIVRIKRDNCRKLIHPTQKPTKLISYLIKTYTEENDLVLDPFCGSGTVGVSCFDIKRKYIGIEKDYKYCELARKRILDNITAVT